MLGEIKNRKITGLLNSDVASAGISYFKRFENKKNCIITSLWVKLEVEYLI